MSLNSWKKEFYPTPASKAKGKKNAIKHSLTKWIGLRKKNLQKHDLVFAYADSPAIYENNELSSRHIKINSQTCALCVLYFNGRGQDSDLMTNKKGTCFKCPLFQSLGNKCDGKFDRPYVKFMDSANPEPMIKALQKTLEDANVHKNSKK